MHWAEVKYQVFIQHTKIAWNLITAAHKVMLPESKNIIFHTAAALSCTVRNFHTCFGLQQVLVRSFPEIQP